MIGAFALALIFASTSIPSDAAKGTRDADHGPHAASNHTNNWAVLVDTSRFWLNYRHISNLLAFYHIVKSLGFTDNNIIFMTGTTLTESFNCLSLLFSLNQSVGDDMACSPRNPYPACIYHNESHALNLYDNTVEVSDCYPRAWHVPLTVPSHFSQCSSGGLSRI